MKSEICIISCSAKKIWSKSPDVGEVPAKDAYIGPLFKKCREFAEMFFPGRWYILSDKYGIITPDTLISDYNLPPSAIDGNPRFIEFVISQSNSLHLHPTSIVSTTGKIHKSVIRTAFKDAKYIDPLSGLVQGKRMQRLNQLMEAKK